MKNEIDAAEGIEIELNGIAEPVQAYRLKRARKNPDGVIRVDEPGLQLTLDHARLAETDRRRTVELLEEVLRAVKAGR